MKQENQSNFFIECPLFGKVKIIRVFVFYDVPRTFVCENQVNAKYLFSELDEIDDTTSWLVVPISNFRYGELLRNKITLRQALISSETDIFYELNLNFSTNVVDYKPLFECPKDKIIPSDFYVGTVSDVSDDLHQILETANKEGSSFIDVITDQSKDGLPGIDAKSISEIADYSRLFFSSVYGRSINPLMSTLTGSFVLRFNINEPTNVFDGQDSAKCVNTINKIINDREAKNVYELLKDDRKAVKHYKDFVSSLLKLNRDIKIVTAIPDTDKPTVTDITKRRLEITRDDIGHLLQTTDTKEYDVTGILIEFNSKKPSFQIQLDDKTIIKGSYDPSIYKDDYIYKVNGKVEGRIRETFYLNNDGTAARKKPIFLLLKLIFTEDQ